VIGTADANIRTLSMTNVASDFTEMDLDLEVWDLRQLSHIIAQLKELQCISTVKRVFD
jgi:guanosine-3',5'-bis(diphosphate) 3'-pyrophosphohydrolase